MKVNIANVLVDNVTKDETIQKIDEFVQSGKAHYIVTTYSEFIVFADRDPKYREVLNRADLSIPDGMGIVWAGNYLSGSKVIKEKVSGSKLIWDIAKLAASKNYSMALVGGEDSVAAQSAYELKQKYPSLRVNLALSGRPFDESTVKEIASSNSDILCIAYAPPKQEIWIADNLSYFNVKVAIGLGGTFDYLAGKRIEAPGWMSRIGMEWLWRLITQPYRIKRIWNAVPVFATIIYKSKLKQSHGKNQS
jgi:N-acetylglucosaminyldiphosphoundecaprenol N-acetyl-beta-D-mannosaminyltransferase